MTQTIKTQTTKRPWYINGFDLTSGIYKINKQTKQYSRVFSCALHPNGKEKEIDVAIANARLIVKAINCHDELVEALKGLVNRFELEGFKPMKGFKCSCNQFLDTDMCRHIIAKKALSKAESEVL